MSQLPPITSTAVIRWLIIILIVLGFPQRPAFSKSDNIKFVTPQPFAEWPAVYDQTRRIEGFASADSVAPGEKIDFFVSTHASMYSAKVFRMGWSQGAGADLVTIVSPRRGYYRGLTFFPKKSRRVDEYWPRSFSLRIPVTWQSGFYLVRLQASTGPESYIPFVVRSAKPGKILFVHASLTDHAYNPWGGTSLYIGNTPGVNIGHASGVALNRPFSQDNGAGNFFVWEYPMIRWLERQKYHYDVATDTDIHIHPGLLLKYRVVIIAGHDEYWTKPMRDGYERAVAQGVHLAVFAGNTGYWQSRLDPDAGHPYRHLVTYKMPPENDPLFHTRPDLVTTAWRSSPVNRPESTLLGAMYGNLTNNKVYPFVVSQADHWIYRGTGLKDGDRIDGIIGWETDKVIGGFPQPRHLQIIGASPLTTVTGQPDEADSTIYTAPSGAIVFNAATTNWSWGLDDYHSTQFVSPALQRMTKNIINRMIQTNLANASHH